MRKLIIAAFLTSTAFAGAAFAQTATPEAGTAAPATEGTMAPAGGDAATPGATGEAAGGMEAGGMGGEGGFVTYQEGSQLLASGLMGADVQGPDGETIGTVDDLLLDTDGQVQAIVVGVGGFLGIGTKDVAIMNDQLEFVMAQDVAATEAGGMDAGGTAAAPAAPAGETTSPTTGTTMGGASETGAMSTTGAATTGTAETGAQSGWGWSGAGIDHIMVSYTRDQLEAAPEFESAE